MRIADLKHTDWAFVWLAGNNDWLRRNGDRCQPGALEATLRDLIARDLVAEEVAVSRADPLLERVDAELERDNFIDRGQFEIIYRVLEFQPYDQLICQSCGYTFHPIPLGVSPRISPNVSDYCSDLALDLSRFGDCKKGLTFWTTTEISFMKA